MRCLIGGRNIDGATETSFFFNLNTGLGRPGPALPYPLSSMAFVPHKGTLYLIGGMHLKANKKDAYVFLTGFNGDRDVSIFRAENESWETHADVLDVGRKSLAAFILDRDICYF